MIASILLYVNLAYSDAKLPKIAEKYINTYKEIAVSEMHRTGIPASIKLAQGLLESNWGRSDLATKAKNHFGIKCGNNWPGESYFKKDDDYINGKLISSCFRKYDHVGQSFIDHSDFLSKPRYSKLYDYESTDYKSWAKGLKRAGYASDPKYPNKLIEIIEKYELHIYDQEVLRPIDLEYVVQGSTNTAQETNDSFDEEEIFSNQPVNPIEITAQEITQEDKVELSNEFHVVKEDELMEDIAMQYDVALFRLYARNRMPKGSQPIAGEMIHLKNKIRFKDRPKFIRYPKRTNPDSEFLFESDEP